MSQLLALLVDLVDDAGPLDEAVARSVDPTGSPVLTDRVLVPASDVDALLARLGGDGDRGGVVPVVVAVGAAENAADPVAAVRAHPRARLAGVRLPLPGDPARVRAALPGLPVTVDVQVVLGDDALDPGGLPVLLDLLAGEGLDPVVDGSVAPEALALLLAGAVREGLAVTVRGVRGPVAGGGGAGLLGLLVATARAVESRPRDEVVAGLTGTDAEELAREVTSIDDALALQVRAQLRSVETEDPEGLVAAVLELLG